MTRIDESILVNRYPYPVNVVRQDTLKFYVLFVGFCRRAIKLSLFGMCTFITRRRKIGLAECEYYAHTLGGACAKPTLRAGATRPIQSRRDVFSPGRILRQPAYILKCGSHIDFVARGYADLVVVDVMMYTDRGCLCMCLCM